MDFEVEYSNEEHNDFFTGEKQPIFFMARLVSLTNGKENNILYFIPPEIW